MLSTPESGYLLGEKHVERILDSAHYFDFPISRNEMDKYLDDVSSDFESPQRVRLLLDRFGKLKSESALFQPAESSQRMKVCLAKEPINSNNVFLFHKTTHREI